MTEIANDTEVKTVTEDIRSNKKQWACWGYKQADDDQLVLVGSGTGGLEAVGGTLADDAVAYVLVALTVQDGELSASKHVLLTWVGARVRPVHKARSSPHRVLLYNQLNRHIALTMEYAALTREDLSEQLVREKLAGARSLPPEQLRAAAVQQQQQQQQQQRKGGAAKEAAAADEGGATSVRFEDEGALQAAAAALRDGQLQWLVLSYSPASADVLQLSARGTGGLAEGVAALKPDAVQYVAFRAVQRDPQGTVYGTAKLVLATWVGPKARPAAKARSAVHRLELVRRLAREQLNVHAELQAAAPEDLDDTAVQQKLHASRQLEAAPPAAAKAAPSSSAAPASKAQAAAPAGGKAEAEAALAALRTGASGDFVVLSAGSGGQVQLQARGTGGLAALQGSLPRDGVAWPVLAWSAVQDGHALLKFVLVAWVADGAAPALKARATQQHVAVVQFVRALVPLAAELQATQADELTASALDARLAGSRAANLTAEAPATAASAVGAAASRAKPLDFALADEAAVRAAAAALHSGAASHMVLGYGGSGDALVLLSSGPGGLDKVAPLLQPDACLYAVINVREAGEADTEMSFVKRVFVSWVGERVKPYERARSSQHRLPLYKHINQTAALSAELQATQPGDVSDAVLVAKVHGAFQQPKTDDDALRRAAIADADKRNKQQQQPAAAKKPAAEKKAPADKKPAAAGDKKDAPADGSAALRLEDAAAVDAAVGHVRSGGAGHWASFGYAADASTLAVRARGADGLKGALAGVAADSVSFVLYASAQVDGEFATTKNVLLTHVGSAVKPVVRARSAQHRVALYARINTALQLAGEVQLSGEAEVAELTDARIHQKLLGSRVPSADQPAAAASGPKAQAPAAAVSTEMGFADEKAATAALDELRNDSTPCDWVAFGASDGGKVAVLGKGSGGVQALKAVLKPDQLAYAVVRLQQKDADEGREFGYTTYKFLFVSWVGPGVKPMLKAKSSQQRGSVYKFCATAVGMSGEYQALSADDLTEEKLQEKLSGSRQKF